MRRGGARWHGARGGTARGVQPGPRIHWPRTLARKGREALELAHLRYRDTAARGGVLHCFALDCSGSMLQARQLALAKGVLLRLLERAYQSRSDVSLLCFSGNRAETRLQPSRARPWNEAWLRPIRGGGGTPLTLGMARADQLFERHAQRHPAQQRVLWVLTDGRTNDAPPRPAWADHVVIVDMERHAVPLGRCRKLAADWSAEYMPAP
ncbi:magnesium chelatase subunit ChlD-like protein [Cupriavidus plantarum]|nr:magnesium chelatase subunit ChlD-like protein [Cupriavidus plantarum]